jgi:hypothetical protein
MLAEHTLHSLEGLLTHVGSAECFITLPHSALQCGIVTAWWQSQVEGDAGLAAESRRATGGATGHMTAAGL